MLTLATLAGEGGPAGPRDAWEEGGVVAALGFCLVALFPDLKAPPDGGVEFKPPEL